MSSFFACILMTYVYSLHNLRLHISYTVFDFSDTFAHIQQENYEI